MLGRLEVGLQAGVLCIPDLPTINTSKACVVYTEDFLGGRGQNKELVYPGVSY